MNPQAASAIGKYAPYGDLGCVSPDYPYLAFGEGGASRWADLMHYERTGQVIQVAARRVHQMTGATRDKLFAWLAGYVVHVTGDVTIHPVVERKVGPYADNKGAHRTCEMHQDAYIFQRLNVGDIGLSEYLDSGLGRCGDRKNRTLDEDLARLWSEALAEVHPQEYEKNPPDPRVWHSRFYGILDEFEEGTQLIPFARHVAYDQGLMYPKPDEIDHTFIDSLEVPGSNRLHYDAIFDRAIENIRTMWGHLGEAVYSGSDDALRAFGNWNLDTGRDDAGQLVFWS